MHREFSEPGNVMEFPGNSVPPPGKIITNKIIFSTIEYLHKTIVDWVNTIITISESSDPAQ